MRQEEAERLSLAEVQALEEVSFERVKREDWRFALLIATIVNIVGTEDKQTCKPEDLMPWLKPANPPALPQRIDREKMEEITRMLGGEVRRVN